MIKKALKGVADNIFELYGFARCTVPFILKKPLGYFCDITGRCNLSCEYCWQRETDNWESENSKSNKNELTADQWIDIIKTVPKLSFVAFTGGEPLLFKDFKNILRFVTNRLPYSVNTNGILLDEEICNIMASGKIVNLSVSIDGFADVHDVTRRRKGLFNTIVDNINLLNSVKKKTRSKNPLLTIKTCILDRSLDSLVDFYKFCSETLQANCLDLRFLRTLDNAQFDLRTYASIDDVNNVGQPSCYHHDRKEEIPEVLVKILELSRNKRCKVLIAPKMFKKEEISRFLAVDGKGCYGRCFLPWSILTILPDGSVIPCLSLNLGNIRDFDYDVKKINNTEKYKEFLRWRTDMNKKNISPAPCNGCHFLKVV
ncbi:radical SAM protein [Candidatus Magnetomonas plexicatena]|uniref:radical SAM protein n=1 Tax=Candidatus Magnetomonas plexicatena TaxID=2552947 RepID=UPI001C74E25E|nr:radical SAM protein [Nitrospirales bacterium LBB_01]